VSGIFGIYNRDNTALVEENVTVILDSISYWKPDKRGTWVNNYIALGHTMLWNTPESKLEHLPNKQNDLVITMDARIDNREELVKKLDMLDYPLEKLTDSHLILEAYRKWDEECPKYLLGDFVFSIWDETKKRLFCARDHIGIKSFYYNLNDKNFIYSNDIRAFANLDKKVNDEAVAIYLNIGELWHPTMTFFEEIKKLPPASFLSVSSEKVYQKVYWRAEDSPKIQFDTYEEYSKQLRNLLEDAVLKRLRSENPIASHLSGGLDSSTIATIAARHLHAQKKTLHVYNWVSSQKPKRDVDVNEWLDSQKISELENIDHSYIDLNTEKLCDILTNHDIQMNDTVDLWYEFLVREKAKVDGVQTILSGWGGDELISHGARTYYADKFLKGEFGTVIKEIYTEALRKKRGLRHFVAKIYYKIFVPIFPNSLRCYLPKICCKSENYLGCTHSSFIHKMRNVVIPNTLFKERNIHKDQLDLFNQGHILSRIESWSSSGFNDKIEYCYPLLDKRIVEFALGIPSELYRRQGKSRFVFRDAVVGLLPEEIRWDNTKFESNRVNLLLQIEKEASMLWLQNFKKRKHYQYNSTYINFNLLEDKITSLKEIENMTLDEQFLYVDTLLKSILTYNLNYNKIRKNV